MLYNKKYSAHYISDKGNIFKFSIQAIPTELERVKMLIFEYSKNVTPKKYRPPAKRHIHVITKMPLPPKRSSSRSIVETSRKRIKSCFINDAKKKKTEKAENNFNRRNEKEVRVNQKIKKEIEEVEHYVKIEAEEVEEIPLIKTETEEIEETFETFSLSLFLEDNDNIFIKTEERMACKNEKASLDSLNNDNLFNEGNMVWAKLTQKDPFWPAIVLNRETTGFPSCNENQCCVFWLKDNRLSKVPKKYIMDYASYVSKLTIKKSDNSMRKEAIYESIDLYAERKFQTTLELPNNEKLSWLKKNIVNLDAATSLMNVNEENGPSISQGNFNIPGHMWAFIRKIKSTNEKKFQTNLDSESQKNPYNSCSVCTCFTENSHPLFNIKLCTQCTPIYLDNFFECSVRNLKKRFCAICGLEDSDIYTNEGYIWVFCSVCILKYFDLPINEISENWTCFLNNQCVCKGKKNKHDSGLFKVQKTWWDNLSRSYMHFKINEDLCPQFSKMIYLVPGTGNGTINTDKFSVDMGATTKNYIQINWKPRKISYEIKKIISSLEENMTILLLGSAKDIAEPWVYWDHEEYVPLKDLEHLFMEFFCTLIQLEALSLNKQIRIQWIFECSSSIPAFTRKRNTRFLKVSPMIVDIPTNKGVNGFRFIWTNLNKTEEFFRQILNV